MFAQRRLLQTLSHVTARRTMGTKAINDSDVCIVSAVRTPMGSFNGALSSLSGVELGSLAVKEAVKRAGVDTSKINEVILGNVIASNLGQAPARQAAIGAGVPASAVCTTVNKVCSSGMKAVMLGANEIKLGNADIIVSGGFESMSNIPYYLPSMRNGARLGDSTVIDGLMKDGLTDAYGKYPMGNCAEVCADHMKFTREQQDNYAMESYKRSQKATENGKFTAEIVPVEIKSRKGVTTVSADEEVYKVDFAKLGGLKPVFKNPMNPTATTTVTAGNASVISDGAAALVLVSGKYAKENNLTVMGRVLGYADHEQDPVWFTTAPSGAVPKALARAGVDASKIDLYEFNEAFSVVALANAEILKLDTAKINVYGGAVSLGHPLGCSGARIVVTLLHALKQEKGTGLGVAAICNGGGGASAIVVEAL